LAWRCASPPRSGRHSCAGCPCSRAWRIRRRAPLRSR
jgi:hypothetical protein